MRTETEVRERFEDAMLLALKVWSKGPPDNKEWCLVVGRRNMDLPLKLLRRMQPYRAALIVAAKAHFGLLTL